MAEETGQSKTEAPTQRRRDEARKQGRVAVSQELASSVLFFAAILALMLGSKGLGAGLLDSVRIGLTVSPHHDLSVSESEALLGRFMSLGAHLVAPILGLLFVVALGVMVLQVGFHLLPELLALRPDRLLPMEGLSRIFSLEGAWRGLAAILKIGVICAVAYFACCGRRHEVVALGQHDLATTVGIGWDITLRLAMTAAVALVVLGVVDFGVKWFRLEQSLRMSKQEQIDEYKEEEGDPKVKARIRKLGRELSQRRMMQAVPEATVVITNPTHLAIALRYDKGTQSAPSVVAKGAGHVATRIIETARRHAVPVVERKPVARALFKAVKVGQTIPMTLYKAVAEVLAYVYRLRGVVRVGEDSLSHRE